MKKRHIDCHNHLAQVWALDLPKAKTWVQQSLEKNIFFHMQGGIGPENWENQLNLNTHYPQQIGLCFGLHPYWVAENEEPTCELALDQLSQLLSTTKKTIQSSGLKTPLALGELGLDFRPQIMKSSKELQIRMLEMQLEMIPWFQIPAVLHLVRAFPEAQRVFDFWGDDRLTGLVHSFNGPWEQAKYWIKKGFLISVGGPICYETNQKLQKTIKEIPLEHLVLETDSPDQPPPAYTKGENPPYSLWDVAKTIGSIRNLDAEEILDISNKNFQRVFGEIKDGSQSPHP